MKDQDYIFLDLETTGGNPIKNRIIEVGLIHIRNNEIIDRWQTLVNPGMMIPNYIQEFTGISNAMVQNAPSFEDIHQELLEKLQGKVFTAHNARFDYGFLKNEYRRLDIRFQAPVLCTVRLSRRLYPQYRRHGLDALIERFNIQIDDRHRAMGDVMAMWQFWQQIYQELGTEVVDRELASLLKKPSLPPHLDEQEVADLPEAPGVYLFYGKERELLYVGKSKDLKARVWSHFSGDHRKNKEMRMSQLVHHVEWIETAGEMGALLKEAHIIKEKTPIFNRRLRRTRSLNSFRLKSQQPHPVVEIVSAEQVQPEEFSSLYGLFRTKPDAKRTLKKIAQQYQLCEQSIGLEKGTGACFNLQLNKCRGVCCGEEPVDEHQERFHSALSRLKLQTWPYNGMIGVREQDAYEERTDIHLFDNWCYLGTARSEEELYEMQESPQERIFDLDIYKILIRQLKKRSVQVQKFS